MPKKPAKQKKPVAPKAKTKPSQELSDEQLERVAGGAFDAFRRIDGAPAPTTTQQPTESISLNYAKINIEYKPQ